MNIKKSKISLYLSICILVIFLFFTVQLFYSNKEKQDTNASSHFVSKKDCINEKTAHEKNSFLNQILHDDNIHRLHEISLSRQAELSDKTTISHSQNYAQEKKHVEIDNIDNNAALETTSQDIDYVAIIDFAKKCIEANDLDTFWTEYNKVISTYPDNIELSQNMAQFFMENDLPQEAEEILFMNIDNNPAKKEFYYLIGDFYAMYELYDDAIYHYSQALNLDNQDAAGYYKLSEMYQKLGQQQLAQSYLDYYNLMQPL